MHVCSDVSPTPIQWRVDLGKQYQLHKINIFNTKGNEKRLKGFKIYIDNSNTPCYQWTRQSNPPEVFDVICDAQGQFVTFQLPSPTYLQLCEVQIFVCTDYWYGDNCDKTCNCGNQNEICDKRTGLCKSGCPVGRTGVACELCDQGYYGTNCSETCGNCVNGSTCHNVTGSCPGGCSAGWRDDTCKRACEDGYYGAKCNNSCGHCLNGNTACNKVTGYCHDGCGAGWKGDTCKIECSNGTHGKNCEQTCSNCKESNCDRFNGTCVNGCIAGYANPDTGCVEKFVAGDNTVGVAAGGAAAAIAVIVVVIIAVVFWKRRHKKESSVKEDFTDLKCISPPPHKGEIS
ncbi:multiple epidermal growth factor-like domains protein 10 isoform X1 [Gigantopelta aegis]|uniref:multiple epidermal growth factor-like domains protein 10 isoform X1 n=1 Tax=Gigantopelta aegis TaxID=1735272 RepID=UPI001B889404|nr:multiple epidermal growth factor-like domains protein 10 isoform X1 [Gigantopelta aegis]XP_041350908.1 multiple epidermal growth factor-like domains protein 10 isoform X1 [Gigantopelta aegis]